MRGQGRKGLSGAVSAIVIALVLVAGLASASYINLSTARYNEAQMQQALRQARLGNELIRIHIHSTDGSIDSPPKITFVNAWGFESRIKQLVVIARNMTPIAVVNLTQPLVLPPGSRTTVDPATIGLRYATFRELADEIRSIHAYTEAGNSFGSTWGFPREDNLAGRTVAVTYNATTTEVWSIPSVTWHNRTWTKIEYTTIGDIPPVQSATIKARNNFETGVLAAARQFWDWGTTSLTIDDTVVEGYPSAPDPTWMTDRPTFGGVAGQEDRRLYCWNGGYPCQTYGNPGDYYWYPTNGFVSTGYGPTVTVEANTYVALVNRPQRYVITPNSNNGYCAISYALRRVTITPTPEGYQSSERTETRTGMILTISYAGTGNLPPASGPLVTAFNLMELALYYRGERIANYIGLNPNWDVWLRAYPATYVSSFETCPSYCTTTRVTYRWSGTTTFIGKYPYSGTHTPYIGRAVQTYNTIPVNDLTAIYVKLPPGDYTIDRYYYIDSIQCNIYLPSPNIGGSYVDSCETNPNDIRCNPPPRCEVILVVERTQQSGGGGFNGDLYDAILRYVLRCLR